MFQSRRTHEMRGGTPPHPEDGRVVYLPFLRRWTRSPPGERATGPVRRRGAPGGPGPSSWSAWTTLDAERKAPRDANEDG